MGSSEAHLLYFLTLLYEVTMEDQTNNTSLFDFLQVPARQMSSVSLFEGERESRHQRNMKIWQAFHSSIVVWADAMQGNISIYLFLREKLRKRKAEGRDPPQQKLT